jgi:hypothetical protein
VKRSRVAVAAGVPVASLTAPSTVLVGGCDKLTPPRHARRLVETLPDPAELIELPRYGHMLPLEADADVTGCLRGLVERHLGTRPDAAAASSSSSPATASSGSTGNGAPSRSASRSSA